MNQGSSKSAEILLSKLIFYVANRRNFFKKKIFKNINLGFQNPPSLKFHNRTDTSVYDNIIWYGVIRFMHVPCRAYLGFLEKWTELSILPKYQGRQNTTGSSCLVRILLLRFFKTITIILLMQFYGLFILLMRSLAKNLANAIFG